MTEPTAHQGGINHVFVGDTWDDGRCACGVTVADVRRDERADARRWAATVAGVAAAGATAYLVTRRVRRSARK